VFSGAIWTQTSINLINCIFEGNSASDEDGASDVFSPGMYDDDHFFFLHFFFYFFISDFRSKYFIIL
jgi:hypothetical protein